MSELDPIGDSRKTYYNYNNASSQKFAWHNGSSDVYVYDVGSAASPNFVGNDTITNFEEGLDQIVWKQVNATLENFIDYYNDGTGISVDVVHQFRDGNASFTGLGFIKFASSPLSSSNLPQINIINEAQLGAGGKLITGAFLSYSGAITIAEAGAVAAAIGLGAGAAATGAVVIGGVAVVAIGAGFIAVGGAELISEFIHETLQPKLSEVLSLRPQSADGGPNLVNIKVDVVGNSFREGVDKTFYTLNNPDVAASGIDATDHYNQYGWKEGRDPNAFFSTSGYLTANPDVRAAQINPLQHYNTYGWKEGRDPSANFDNEQYLARNPDVKAAGINPLAHYLQNGQAEGRHIYAAVGKAADLAAHPGFDAEYYLLSNPDVAAAALITGGNSYDYAYQHYEANGWKEGRNPNAVFDTKGYLNAYQDVKAAGIDPLMHYEQSGWKEGRDPSRNFDTAGYLAANADVKAASIDPMLHYLQNGAVEGRTIVNDGAFGV